MRAVVDPNVLVSAWISPHGFPRRILDAADNGDFEIVVSQQLLAELAEPRDLSVHVREDGSAGSLLVKRGKRSGNAYARRTDVLNPSLRVEMRHLPVFHRALL